MPGQSLHDERAQLLHRPSVPTSYRCHVNDLSLDQLDPVVLAEDPRLAHAPVLLYRVAVAVDQVFGSGRHVMHLLLLPASSPS